MIHVIGESLIRGLYRNMIPILRDYSLEPLRDRLFDLFFLELNEFPRWMKTLARIAFCPGRSSTECRIVVTHLNSCHLLRVSASPRGAARLHPTVIPIQRVSFVIVDRLAFYRGADELGVPFLQRLGIGIAIGEVPPTEMFDDPGNHPRRRKRVAS